MFQVNKVFQLILEGFYAAVLGYFPEYAAFQRDESQLVFGGEQRAQFIVHFSEHFLACFSPEHAFLKPLEADPFAVFARFKAQTVTTDIVGDTDVHNLELNVNNPTVANRANL